MRAIDQYSSAMIVVGYMLRLRPFTESYLDLQGGTFDHADRMFWSIPKAWESCSRRVSLLIAFKATADSKCRQTKPLRCSRAHPRVSRPPSPRDRAERILFVRFFYLPDFLRNSNDLDLGIRQDGQERIDNVELPPWAKGDPRLFVELHREVRRPLPSITASRLRLSTSSSSQALESEHVSLHLGKWIDLIFGFRQTGDAATESCNVFHHLSYEGAIGRSCLTSRLS